MSKLRGGAGNYAGAPTGGAAPTACHLRLLVSPSLAAPGLRSAHRVLRPAEVEAGLQGEEGLSGARRAGWTGVCITAGCRHAVPVAPELGAAAAAVGGKAIPCQDRRSADRAAMPRPCLGAQHTASLWAHRHRYTMP